MFGSNKTPDQQHNQIPYEVYETVHKPGARRRRLLIRLGVALIAATLLIFGGVQVYKALFRDEPKDQTTSTNQPGQPDAPKNTDKPKPNNDNGSSPQGGQSGTAPGAVVQSPQQNTPLPASGSSPESGLQPNATTNNSTARKPD